MPLIPHHINIFSKGNVFPLITDSRAVLNAKKKKIPSGTG